VERNFGPRPWWLPGRGKGRERAFGPNERKGDFLLLFLFSFISKPFSNMILNQFEFESKPISTKTKVHQHECTTMLLTL